MSWVSLALALLQLVNWIFGQIKESEWREQGKEEVLYEQAKLLLERTAKGKKLVAQIDALSEPELDDLMRRLEGQ